VSDNKPKDAGQRSESTTSMLKPEPRGSELEQGNLCGRWTIGSAARARFQNGEWRTHERWRGDKASSEDAEARAKAAFGEVASEGTFPRTPCRRSVVAQDNSPLLLGSNSANVFFSDTSVHDPWR
jgi:hypothetical protein